MSMLDLGDDQIEFLPAMAVSDIQTICTDGACTRNGKAGALAGIGVYFGPGDARNISKALPGSPQTNNRAELEALRCALAYSVSNPDQPVHIRSDSSYCVNGFSKWIYGWAAAGWTKSDGRAVLNKDLWLKVWHCKTQIYKLNIKCQVSWVRGHSGDPGNEAADRLAVLGVTAHPEYTPPPPRKKTRSKKQKKPRAPKKRRADQLENDL